MTSKIYGNKATLIYHSSARKDACRAAEIKASNRKGFNDAKDAEAAGYRACKKCFHE